MTAIKVQRNEQFDAVQFKAFNEEDHGVIRSWIGAPLFQPLNDSIKDGAWIIRNTDGSVYGVTEEVFTRDFIRVDTV